MPHLRCESGSAPLQLYLKGGFPDTDGNAALVLFRETQDGRESSRRYEMKKTYGVSFLIQGNYTDSNLCGTGNVEAESEEQAIAFFKEDWTKLREA